MERKAYLNSRQSNDSNGGGVETGEKGVHYIWKLLLNPFDTEGERVHANGTRKAAIDILAEACTGYMLYLPPHGKDKESWQKTSMDEGDTERHLRTTRAGQCLADCEKFLILTSGLVSFPALTISH